MELLPQLPHPSVVVGLSPLKKLPPFIVEHIWFTTIRDTGSMSIAYSTFALLSEWMDAEWPLPPTSRLLSAMFTPSCQVLY